MSSVAEFPNPAYTCKQFSSYDRAAKSPKDNWFANDDYGQFLRTEENDGRKEYVMMDTDGPGAIVRIWSANPAGTIRIYIDNESSPALQAPMTDLLGGKFAGLPRPIAGEYSKGWNLYFPIPYARHCKVTSDEGKFYYHVNYRTYASGTEVEPFTAGQVQSLAARIKKLGDQLAQPATTNDDNDQVEEFNFELAPGESMQEELTGSKAISRALVHIDAEDREAALRGVVVKITFDGNKCVETPMGDLFGSAPGINPFVTLPLEMSKDGDMRSRWFMPFRESAIIELANHSKVKATVSGNIALREYDWTSRSMHFHAKWRTQWDVPTRPMQDWNYLTAKGQGVFAGVSFSIDNPVKEWWGEGDEKIYVDGETFPSHFGTGTEDYYGYAWCWPAPFTHAYHAQPRCDGPANYGRTSVNRFHIADRIPFRNDFKFDMELWHWKGCNVNMAVVAYWYARPGGSDSFKQVNASDCVIRPMPAYVVPKVAGALEGEGLKVFSVTGTVEPQDVDGTSAGQHLWWHAGMKPGDELKVRFSAPKAGRYHVLGRFVKARDYGIHQLSINGGKTGEPIDFYNPDVTPSKEIDLGMAELRQGENELTVKVVGANEKAVKAYMFGLDYLMLKPE